MLLCLYFILNNNLFAQIFNVNQIYFLSEFNYHIFLQMNNWIVLRVYSLIAINDKFFKKNCNCLQFISSFQLIYSVHVDDIMLFIIINVCVFCYLSTITYNLSQVPFYFILSLLCIVTINIRITNILLSSLLYDILSVHWNRI